MAVEKIRMFAQIGHHFACADLDRTYRRRKPATNRLRLVLRTVGHV
jgi:hypothetical protein